MLPYVLAHTDVGNGSTEVTYQIETPVSGRIKDINLTFNQSSTWNQPGALGIIVSGNPLDYDDQNKDLIEDFLEGMSQQDRAISLPTPHTIFFFRLDSAQEKVQKLKRKGLINLQRGQTAYITFFFHMTADPTAGQIEGMIEMDLDVFELDYYGQVTHPARQAHVNIYSYANLGADAGIMWMPPADGKIGNLRLEVFDELNRQEMVYFNGTKLQSPLLTTDQLEIQPEISYYITGSHSDPEATTVNRMTAYWPDKHKVEKNQAWYLMNDGDQAHEVFLEFSYIPFYGTPIEIAYYDSLIESDEDMLSVFTLPYDMQIHHIEVDMMASGLDNEYYLEIYALKPPFNLDHIEGHSNTKGMFLDAGIDANLSTDSITGGFLDRIPVLATQGGGTARTIEKTIPVQDAYKAGSVIILSNTGTYDVGDFVRLTMTVRGFSMIKGNYMGINVKMDTKAVHFYRNEVMDVEF